MEVREKVFRRTNFSMFNQQKEDQWSRNFPEVTLPKLKKRNTKEDIKEHPVGNRQ